MTIILFKLLVTGTFQLKKKLFQVKLRYKKYLLPIEISLKPMAQKYSKYVILTYIKTSSSKISIRFLVSSFGALVFFWIMNPLRWPELISATILSPSLRASKSLAMSVSRWKFFAIIALSGKFPTDKQCSISAPPNAFLKYKLNN